MTIIFRNYNNPEDYNRVSDFLIQHHQPDIADGNWLEPAWEYMQNHPYLDQASLEKIGIWEEAGAIVTVAHYESQLGEAFFELHPDYKHLQRDMLNYAEQTFQGTSKDGRKFLQVYVNEMDEEFITLIKARGYTKDDEGTRPMYKFEIPNPFPEIKLPEGFQLKSLADECNWAKVHRVIWRGFDHEGEPPAGEDELESRRKMFETPTARHDLKISVEAPNSDFVSFCGMFYEPTHKYAYVDLNQTASMKPGRIIRISRGVPPKCSKACMWQRSTVGKSWCITNWAHR